ncbi:MAG: tyrosine-type recombinase/integrase [Clostridiales Family XIII bacterium]|jgi:integrase|nr:tyrosine-type recombinase/integrase [Clostridiales Family XIII bacterium]
MPRKNQPHKEHRVSFRYNGKRYWVEADTEKDLAVQLELKKWELEHGESLSGKKTTVDAWATEYLETYRRDYISLAYYRGLITQKNIISAEIGKMPLGEVKRIHCERIIAEMARKGMSKEYIGKVRGLMVSMFDVAIDNELMLRNPAARIKVPKTAKGKQRRRPATEHEKELLLAAAERLGDPYLAYVELLLYFGLRPSEAGRVQGGDFDLKRRRLHVRGTKSDNATRDVPIPETMMERAACWRRAPFEYILKNAQGYPTNKEVRQRFWRALRREVNIHGGSTVYRNQVKGPLVLADDLTAYCLRHSYASDRIAEGIPKEVVSLFMGHADLDVTDIYIDPTDEMYSRALAKMDAPAKAPSPVAYATGNGGVVGYSGVFDGAETAEK